MHEKREHDRAMMPQDSDPRLACEQLLLAFVATDPQPLLLPFGLYAMDSPGPVVRREADLHAWNFLQLARQIFGLTGALPVESRKVQPRIFFGGHPHPDHLLTPHLQRPPQRVRMRAGVEPRRPHQIPAAGQNARALRATHMLAPAE